MSGACFSFFVSCDFFFPPLFPLFCFLIFFFFCRVLIRWHSNACHVGIFFSSFFFSGVVVFRKRHARASRDDGGFGINRSPSAAGARLSTRTTARFTSGSSIAKVCLVREGYISILGVPGYPP